ncbi:MAG: endolytic transglycosylase MltG [Negativicutes bacterium]|nr:endolytic transglycosylase MltG [Negativicutes bacterium]
MKNKLNCILLVVIGVLMIGSIVFGMAKPAVLNTKDQAIIAVKPGMTANDIGELLYNEKIINSVIMFRVMAKFHNMESSLQAGEYAFSKNMSLDQIVTMLAKGQTTYRQITIPEGYNVDQIAKLIKQKGFGDDTKFKKMAKIYTPYAYMTSSANASYKAEGYIFPNTYHIPRNTTEEQLLTLMVKEFDNQFTPTMRARAVELGLSVSDVITLASLVEKEAKLDGDRPIIAKIFMNRLKQDMPLQSCATIQYILGYPKPELSIEDTRIESPYNTYQHMGLPPGPIANPGGASINAVLYPSDADYLYFVADKEGAHHYSRTYQEHLDFIEKVSN